MSTDLFTEFNRVAEQQVHDYDQQCSEHEDEAMRLHHEVKDCWKCEDRIQLGLGILRGFEGAEAFLRKADADGYLTLPPDFEDRFEALYRLWLRPCSRVRAWIALHTDKGRDVEGEQDFFDACNRVEYWLARNSRLNDILSDAEGR